MIAQVAGTLVTKDLDRVEVMTAGGVAYDMAIPLSAYETLPRVGDAVTLQTHLVVKEDAWQLFGFATVFERRVFQRVLNAKGVGPALALGMMSSLTAERLIRAVREKDVATLQSVPRVGRKKAEQIILDLADKLDDLQLGGGGGDAAGTSRAGGVGAEPGAEDAVRALVSLGYAQVDAERAVREAIDSSGRGAGAADLIRSALSKIRG